MNHDSRIHIDGLKPADIALLRDVAESAADVAVKKTLIAMGLDPAKPLDHQADMVWLRATRERCDNAAGRAILTIIALVVGSALTALWVGFRTLVMK